MECQIFNISINAASILRSAIAGNRAIVERNSVLIAKDTAAIKHAGIAGNRAVVGGYGAAFVTNARPVKGCVPGDSAVVESDCAGVVDSSSVPICTIAGDDTVVYCQRRRILDPTSPGIGLSIGNG